MTDSEFLTLAASAVSKAADDLAADNEAVRLGQRPAPIVAEKREQLTLGGRVTYTLTGPEDAVKVRAQQIFDDYPPMGYGTRITVFPDRTVIVRAGSCD